MHRHHVESFLKSGALITLPSGDLLMGYGDILWSSSPCEDCSFYFPDYFLEERCPWMHCELTSVISIDELLEILPSNHCESEPITWSTPDKEYFFDTINTFHWGDIKKIVPYLFETAQVRMTSEQKVSILRNLLQYAKSYPLNLYGFWIGDIGALGATPEVLFRMAKDQNIITEACAGTSTDEYQILNDPKLQVEHQYVVDGISTSLSPFGSVKVGQRYPVHVGNFWHLKTPVEVEVSTPVVVNDIVQALHPTPALGAFPKDLGAEWLKNYSVKIPRERFGAPVGCFNSGEFISYVGIRNIQWAHGEVKMGAGCGVVEQSCPKEEWDEFRLKVGSIKRMIGYE